MIIGMSIRTEAFQIREVYFIERKNFQGIYVVRVKIDKNRSTRPDHVWPEVCTKIGKAAQNRETQELAKEKPKLDNARRLREGFTLSILMTKNTEKFSKWRKENWKDQWYQPCPVEELRIASRSCLHNRRLHPRRLQKRFMVVQWNLLNPQDNEWNRLNPKIMKTTLQAEDLLR